MFCGQCGKNLPDVASFCNSCGLATARVPIAMCVIVGTFPTKQNWLEILRRKP